MKLADDQMCFGCGGRNARGLKLRFTLDEARHRIRAEWTPLKEHQGYAEIVHGGMIGLVLDELMGNLPWISSQKGRIAHIEAIARNAAGIAVAEAKGRFVQVKT